MHVAYLWFMVEPLACFIVLYEKLESIQVINLPFSFLEVASCRTQHVVNMKTVMPLKYTVGLKL